LKANGYRILKKLTVKSMEIWELHSHIIKHLGR
jgi:hypothetical protein